MRFVTRTGVVGEEELDVMYALCDLQNEFGDLWLPGYPTTGMEAKWSSTAKRWTYRE